MHLLPTAADAQTLLGSSVVQPTPDKNVAGVAEAFQATAVGSGTVAQLHLYIDAKSAAKRVALGLYADQLGHPGALLAQAVLKAPVKSAWNSVSLPPVPVSAGQAYWLALLSPSGAGVVRFREGSAGGPSETHAAAGLAKLPSTWSTGSAFASGPVSMYATGSVADGPVLLVQPGSLSFVATVGSAGPLPQTLGITNRGTGALSFGASSSQSWLSVAPSDGTAPATVQVSVNASALAAGRYSGQVSVVAPGAVGSPANVPVTLTVSPPQDARADWPMVGQNPARTGQAAFETLLDKTNVNRLVLQWSAALDGKVSAQPLFLGGVLFNDVPHDVVIAGSNLNTLYAFDADTGVPLWSTNLGANVGNAYAVPGGLGIRSAPVVDRAGLRLFVMSDSGKLHTLSLTTGAALAAPLQLIDLPATNKVRGGLNLFNGRLYVASGSNGGDEAPWRGRIYQLDVSGTQPLLAATFDVIPGIAGNNRGGGIWSYGGVSVDPATGQVYAATGADFRSQYTPYAVRMLKLSPSLSLIGSYEPPHPQSYTCDTSPCDVDFASTPTVFTPAGCPSMVAAGNKDGHLYVMRTADFAETSQVYQALTLNTADDALRRGGVGGVPAFWPEGNMLFVTDAGNGAGGVAAGVVALSVSAAPACQLSVAWSRALPQLGSAQSSPTVVGDMVLLGEGGSGVVHAYDALTGTELWNSGAAVSGNTYAAPTVGRGRVFVGSWVGSEVEDYGFVRAFALGPASERKRFSVRQSVPRPVQSQEAKAAPDAARSPVSTRRSPGH